MEVEGTVLKWGNSMGIRLNKAALEGLEIRENDKVTLKITKIKNPLLEMFGALKHAPISSDTIRQVRLEWEKH